MRNAIGIDIGGTHTRAARVCADGRILDRLECPTAQTAQLVLTDLKKMVAGLRDSKTATIGIGVPGRVDARSGRVLSGGFVDLSGLLLAQQLGQTAGLETFTDNDANMALVAEARLGAAHGYDHAIMLTIGTGIGGAILANGRIFHGSGTAGQLGHIIVNVKGTPCNCGRSGCLETESSGTALGCHMMAAGLSADVKVEDLLRAGTAESQAIVTAWATPLRAGIDSLVAVIGPEIVVLGGGLGAAAAKAIAGIPAVSPWFQCSVVAARLGDEAGVTGAALAALERFP